MTKRDPLTDAPGDYIVPLPRVTDALGQSLRRVYPTAAPLDEFAALLRRIDMRH